MGIATKVVISGETEAERREAAKQFLCAQADFARACGQFKLGNAYARRAAAETDPDFPDKEMIDRMAEEMLESMAQKRIDDGDEPMSPEILVALFGAMAEMVSSQICRALPFLDDGEPIATC